MTKEQTNKLKELRDHAHRLALELVAVNMDLHAVINGDTADNLLTLQEKQRAQ